MRFHCIVGLAAVGVSAGGFAPKAEENLLDSGRDACFSAARAAFSELHFSSFRPT
jgi:hypothetical protein